MTMKQANHRMTMMRLALRRDTVVVAFRIALIVGLLLNLINQGERLMTGDFAGVNWLKFVVTFFVPYAVSTYSTVTALQKIQPGSRAPASARLVCDNCGRRIDVARHQIVPDCGHCGGGQWSQEALRSN